MTLHHPDVCKDGADWPATETFPGWMISRADLLPRQQDNPAIRQASSEYLARCHHVLYTLCMVDHVGRLRFDDLQNGQGTSQPGKAECVFALQLPCRCF